ncbi:MAG: hypothetical protein PHY45_15495, partial [Rhodocyclaceae bacterium]|nr:hypothetical protein [Rhodocyclaceae bacterium]
MEQRSPALPASAAVGAADVAGVRPPARERVGQPARAAGTRVNEIDLLRFVAALSVVFFHYSFRGYAADAMSVMPYPLLAPFSKYGYLGVELFF